MSKIKNFFIDEKDIFFLFFVRVILDCLLSINFRAIASANYPQTIATDATLAAFNFLVIKRIATSHDVSTKLLLAYMLGSAVGACLGLWMSTSF